MAPPTSAMRLARLVCLASLVSARGVAGGAPVATLSADVDGDGVADAIELGADGVVRIAGKLRGEVKLAAASASGELAMAHYRGKHYVVARIVAGPVPASAPSAAGAPDAAPSEGVILSADGGSWHEVARFALGGVGLD